MTGPNLKLGLGDDAMEMCRLRYEMVMKLEGDLDLSDCPIY